MSRNATNSNSETRYTLKELSDRSGVGERAIRFYTTKGLLPPPLTRGRYASYTRGHLHRLQLITHLKGAYLPLAAIRKELNRLTDDEVAALAEANFTPVHSATIVPVVTDRGEARQAPASHGLALEIDTPSRGIARAQPLRTVIVAPRVLPMDGHSSTTDSEGWRRVSLAPGIEIHARLSLPPDIEHTLGQIIAEARVKLQPGTAHAHHASRHAHPRGFHLVRHIDRGWGELAFQYKWDASDGSEPDVYGELNSLSRCVLFEVTTYDANEGRYEEGWFYPPDPPFAGWRFRDPTDGRTAEVGMECFVATHGRAWDRHKIGGPLLPPADPAVFTCMATQTYRFFCEECGADQTIPGPHGGPHDIIRTFGPAPGGTGWRYTITKHGHSAWMDLDETGFLTDSLGLDFGPW